MADKDFKTLEKQLEILRSRGLTINDESQAMDFLLHFTLSHPYTFRLHLLSPENSYFHTKPPDNL